MFTNVGASRSWQGTARLGAAQFGSVGQGRARQGREGAAAPFSLASKILIIEGLDHAPITVYSWGVLKTILISMSDSFSVEVVQMTPEWAAKLLLSNTSNRGLSKTRSKTFAKQIEKGKWRKTGQGISVAKNGRLLDGQTRLNAVVQSGISTTMVVAWNCDEDSFSVFDTGRARSATDVLKIAGCEQHQNMISAGLRLAIPLIENPEAYFAISQGITNEEILNLWEESKGQCEWCANSASSVHNQFKTFSKSIYFTFLYLATNKGWEQHQLTEFSDMLASGADLEGNSPILAYRQYVNNNFLKCNMNQQRLTTLASLIRCFNLHVTGGSIRKFQPPRIPPMIQIEAPA